jgi:hypothetical protein
MWRDWFGWPFELSVCFAALISVGYVYMRWRKIHPWYCMVIIDVTGLLWGLYWFGWSIHEHQWVSAVLWPLLLIWFGRKSVRIWRRRESRHLPYP